MDGAQTSLTIQFQNGVPGSTTNFGDSSKDQFYLGLTGLKNIDFGTKGKRGDPFLSSLHYYYVIYVP